MNARIRKLRNRRAGFLLVESLIYGGLFMGILGVGIVVFNDFQVRSLRLQRNTREIAQVLQLGEQWRQQVRAAATIEQIGDTAPPVLRINGAEESVEYMVADGALLKRTGEGQWIRLLPSVAASTMTSEQRAHCRVWTWEIELASREKSPRLKPIFTFLAVQPKASP